jgi:hypothetical protein
MPLTIFLRLTDHHERLLRILDLAIVYDLRSGQGAISVRGNAVYNMGIEGDDEAAQV